MDDRDGFYLQNTWVATTEGIATSYQGNDLSKPGQLQSTYSNNFNLADSLIVRKLTQNAEQLDSLSRFPYKLIPAMLIMNGEITFNGLAKLTQFQAGWSVELVEGKRDLFSRLDRKIQTADLSRYDHEWSLETINKLAESTEGVVYPLVDYGLLLDNVLPADTVFPSVYLKTVVGQMLHEEGYRLIGSLPTDPMYNALLLPFAEETPTNNDEEWKTDRSARVCYKIADHIQTETYKRRPFDNGNCVERIQDWDDDESEGFSQGALRPFNVLTSRYICPDDMRLHINAFQGFKAYCIVGGIELILAVVKNSEHVDSARFEAGDSYNVLNLRVDSLTLDSIVNCKKGDKIEIALIARRISKVGAFGFEIYNDPDNSWVAFEPDLTTATGDTWKVSRNLPDMTGSDILLTLAAMYSADWDVNSTRREIKLRRLTDTLNNVNNAVDWTSRLDTGSEPGWVPKLEPYAQTNYLKWKEIEETKKLAQVSVKDGVKKFLNYGDGIIKVNAETLDYETDLFELPFAASTDSEQQINDYGNPVLIKLRAYSGRGSNLSISTVSTTARLLLISPNAFEVDVSRIAADGVTPEKVKTKLRGCWFGQRPRAIRSESNKFTLSFGPLLKHSGEVCLIDANYQGLIRVLRRMRVFTPIMRLYPTDISSLDFSRPILLGKTQCGSLTLNDGYYYLNKIPNFQDVKKCNAILIAF